MKVTMLYSNTISALIAEHGYTWQDVDAITDNNNRVKFGSNNEHSSSLENMFYSSHMGGNWNAYTWKQNIIDAFIEAIEETKQAAIQAKEQTNNTVDPTDYKTGERIKTPRGTFAVVSLTVNQMNNAGYGYHHSSNNNEYHIMGNGERAFAIPLD